MERQIKVYSGYIKDDKTAGPKARIDIEKILEKDFNAKIETLTNNSNKLLSIINKLFFYINSLFCFNKIVVIQYPIGKHFLQSFAKHKILFIHDIDGLRFEDKRLLNKEINYFKKFDYIICHNKVMEKYLKDKGITSKIYNFEYWIYLSQRIGKKSNHNFNNIAYAGNINKTSFYNELEENRMQFNLCVYSSDKIKPNNNKIKYVGGYNPDELPSKISEPLGLVWDGSIDERDQNSLYKNYTKYNNPHKVGCYIAAGIPIIVWEKSALANLVKKYNIGYTIKSLYDINNLNYKDYDEKINSINKLQNGVIEGKHFIKLFNIIFKDIKDEESKRNNN